MLPIPDFEDYFLSREGGIFSVRKKIWLKPVYSVGGYYQVTISNDKKSKRILIHREVAKMFLPKFDKNLIVSHIDGNKKNNDWKNLECLTRKENAKKRKLII